VEGERSEHVFAYLRRHGSRAVIVAVPRLVAGLGITSLAEFPSVDWKETRIVLPADLPEARWVNRLSRTEVAPGAVSGLFSAFPVALLTTP
jgi:(1->4)-alpha-D-glucan 1-alpha-D-glucosylmutase